MPASPRRPRTTLSRPVAYALAAAVIFMSLFASGAPSPLYGSYSALWGFSPIVLTLVYATYAFGVLASLILAGRLSDDVGRRPVLLGAIGALMVSTVLFMLADSVAWLFVARGLQGIATGASLSAASAALLDLHPRRDTAGVSLTNGVASTAGIGLGVLVSAALVELAPAPRVLPYAAELVLFAIAFAGALRMPETVAHRSRLRLQPERPSVPRALRRPFFLAGMAALSAYTVGGLFLSLGPQLAGQLFHTPNHLVAGLGVFALAAAASAAQRVFGRVPPWAEAAGGSVALALGMLVIVLAVTAGSSALFLIGAVIGGGGFGVTLPRRPAGAGGGDTPRAPRRGDVRLLHRRLLRAVGPSDRRRRGDDQPRPTLDVRDLRRHRGGARADRRRRGVAHAAARASRARDAGTDGVADGGGRARRLDS